MNKRKSYLAAVLVVIAFVALLSSNRVDKSFAGRPQYQTTGAYQMAVTDDFLLILDTSTGKTKMYPISRITKHLSKMSDQTDWFEIDVNKSPALRR